MLASIYMIRLLETKTNYLKYNVKNKLYEKTTVEERNERNH